MGRKISLLALKRILEIMWGKNGSIDVIDLGNDFFWSNFNLEDAVIDKIAAWIRLHGLAIEYYNRTILEKIGNIIGRTIKVDTNTADVSRGKIARICVEVDLEKPLVSQYQINGKTHLVEYEGIHLVCFHCGMVGHEKQNYPGRQKQNQSCIHQGSEAEEVQRSGSEVEDRGKDGKKEKEKGKSVITEEAEAFGPWMIVQRPTRGKKPNKSGEDTSSGGSAKEKEKENTVRENQSRFATLENVVPEYERIDVREKEDSTIEKDKAIRRRKNKILKLRNRDGVWCEEQEELRDMAINYYKELYWEDKPESHDLNLEIIYPPINEEMRNSFQIPPTQKDIKEALFSIGSLKALGEDGYPAFFFKEN
nr:uncharacterized protein LOC112727420 [Arachis hypogaea]